MQKQNFCQAYIHKAWAKFAGRKVTLKSPLMAITGMISPAPGLCQAVAQK
jgi:hypothetical protein